MKTLLNPLLDDLEKTRNILLTILETEPDNEDVRNALKDADHAVYIAVLMKWALALHDELDRKAREEREQAMVEAIRNDPEIGKDSQSFIDECYTDSELTDFLRSCGISTPEYALEVALAICKADKERSSI